MLNKHLCLRILAVLAGLFVTITIIENISDKSIIDMGLSDALPILGIAFGPLLIMWGMFSFPETVPTSIQARMISVSPTLLACSLMIAYLSLHSALQYLWVGAVFVAIALTVALTGRIFSLLARITA